MTDDCGILRLAGVARRHAGRRRRGLCACRDTYEGEPHEPANWRCRRSPHGLGSSLSPGVELRRLPPSYAREPRGGAGPQHDGRQHAGQPRQPRRGRRHERHLRPDSPRRNGSSGWCTCTRPTQIGCPIPTTWNSRSPWPTPRRGAENLTPREEPAEDLSQIRVRERAAARTAGRAGARSSAQVSLMAQRSQEGQPRRTQTARNGADPRRERRGKKLVARAVQVLLQSPRRKRPVCA